MAYQLYSVIVLGMKVCYGSVWVVHTTFGHVRMNAHASCRNYTYFMLFPWHNNYNMTVSWSFLTEHSLLLPIGQCDMRFCTRCNIIRILYISNGILQ